MICSINKAPYDDVFYAGFTSACRRLKRKWDIDVVTVEQMGDNRKIAILNERHGINNCTSCPSAFFLYNYARSQFDRKIYYASTNYLVYFPALANESNTKIINTPKNEYNITSSVALHMS